MLLLTFYRHDAADMLRLIRDRRPASNIPAAVVWRHNPVLGGLAQPTPAVSAFMLMAWAVCCRHHHHHHHHHHSISLSLVSIPALAARATFPQGAPTGSWLLPAHLYSAHPCGPPGLDLDLDLDPQPASLVHALVGSHFYWTLNRCYALVGHACLPLHEQHSCMHAGL